MSEVQTIIRGSYEYYGEVKKIDVSKYIEHGKGTSRWPSGNVYEGDFIDGEMHGKGIYRWSDGDIYEGDFINDNRTGEGIFKWSDGDIYEGDFIDGEMHGKGIFKWSDGDIYEGDFIDGEMHGKGIFKWPNGNIYEGDFIDDNRTGKGIFKWPNGNVYEGYFVDGVRHGKGIYRWSDGRVYEGDFVKDEFVGKMSYEVENYNTLFSTKDIKDTTIDEAISKLNSLYGLQSVKDEINKLIKMENMTLERRKLGIIDSDKSRLSFMFYGNPGTGKTTVARLIGEILLNLGILGKGHTIEVDRSSLVGSYIGETEKKTLNILEKAKGGILFIDEAYTLIGEGNDFGPKAIEVIMKYMEDNQGEIVVIFAGYHDEMLEFMRINPGIRSRITHDIEFEDYSKEDLLEIAKLYCFKKKYSMDESGIKAFSEIIEKKKAYKNFSNAREVELVIDEAIRNLATKFDVNKDISIDALSTLTNLEFGVEIGVNSEQKIDQIKRELHEMVGLHEIKSVVDDIIAMEQYRKLASSMGIEVEKINTNHMLFLGNAGTGKTTIAKIVAQIFNELGILQTDTVVSINAHQLLGRYIGETAKITKKIAEDAYGGVLFIDEAYGLIDKSNGSGFGSDAIEVLIDEMETNRDKLIVIFAGYEKEIFDLLDKNQGLKSRFVHHLHFKDYEESELFEIFILEASKQGFAVAEEAKEAVRNVIDNLVYNKTKGFGNGREIRNLFEIIKINQAKRVLKNSQFQNKEEFLKITFEDIC